ncbi:MAG: 6-phosphogluconolactonase [Bacteriovoracaceae bacterium]|nr:6-phosphogluconolactonase [Bacteriovoracaceae bacterium]
MKIISNTDKSKLNISALRILEESILNILKNKNHLTLGISGGRGVTELFKLMGNSTNIPWNLVHIFTVDERCVPITHEDSNYKLANDLFINRLTDKGLLPKINVHPFSYNELLNDFGVSNYNQQLRNLGGKLDLIIIGMGDDGHIASLFPHHDSIKNEDEFFISIKNSPKPPPSRMSSSKKLLMNTHTSLLLSFGTSKQNAFSNFKNDSLSVYDCPAKIIKSIPNSYIFTDLEL